MKASQTNLFEHSEAKVNLLGEYLKAYLPIIAHAGFTKQIHLYDLFCGEGLYENQGEGSPLILLKTVRDFYANYTGKPMIPKVNFYFNDIEADKIEKLKNVIEEKQLYQKKWGELHFTTERYEDKLPQVISHIKTLNGKKEKAFLFIDPYDYKSIRASQIKDLMCKETEVLLWQPTQFMYRFAENGTPQALTDFLSEIMDYMQLKNVPSIWDFIHQITDGFRNYSY
jgi:three-Cys-motif partner protein